MKPVATLLTSLTLQVVLKDKRMDAVVSFFLYQLKMLSNLCEPTHLPIQVASRHFRVFLFVVSNFHTLINVKVIDSVGMRSKVTYPTCDGLDTIFQSVKTSRRLPPSPHFEILYPAA